MLAFLFLGLIQRPRRGFDLLQRQLVVRIEVVYSLARRLVNIEHDVDRLIIEFDHAVNHGIPHGASSVIQEFLALNHFKQGEGLDLARRLFSINLLFLTF